MFHTQEHGKVRFVVDDDDDDNNLQQRLCSSRFPLEKFVALIIYTASLIALPPPPSGCSLQQQLRLRVTMVVADDIPLFLLEMRKFLGRSVTDF